MSDQKPAVKYFGPIVARINHQGQCIELAYRPQQQPLPKKTRQSVIDWARDKLQAEYPGYTVNNPGNR